MAKLNLTKGDTRLIINECKAQGLLRNQVAYVLATTRWETASKMKPVREYGGEKYLRSKRYYPYVGMGYVQLTWAENYKKAGKELGVDFMADPKKLLRPEYAVLILVKGMVEGWFTGKRLNHYITLSKSDFVNARRIINGTDKKHEIASLARQYDKLLHAEGYGVVLPAEVKAALDKTAAKDRVSSTKTTSVITGVTGVAATVKPIKDAIDQAKDLGDTVISAGPWVLIAIILAFGAFYIWKERTKHAKLAAIAKSVTDNFSNVPEPGLNE